MGHYFKWIINEENPIIVTEEGVGNHGMTNTISEEEVQKSIRRNEMWQVCRGRLNTRGFIEMDGYIWGSPTV